MIYYIADCHFHHGHVIGYDKRPFTSVGNMNTYMIDAWNNRVTSKDDVFILGDLSYGTPAEIEHLLSQLHGRLHLIRGNHDKFARGRAVNLSRFVHIVDYLDMVDNKRRVILSHYPMLCYTGQYRGSYMLFGHLHNNKEHQLLKKSAEIYRSEGIPLRLVNCFCGFSHFVPLSLDEWLCLPDAVI